MVLAHNFMAVHSHVKIVSPLNPALVPWGLCDPSPLCLTFFFLNCHVFLRKSFLTMSHTFARFCVFPFIFDLCLFPLWGKWTPLYLPCSIDNCLQNAEIAVCVSASVQSKVPKTKSCLFVDILLQTCAVKYYLGGKEHCNKLCLYSVFFYSGVILTPWYC